MEKLELLKKMISDISHNSKYNGAVFTVAAMVILPFTKAKYM